MFSVDNLKFVITVDYFMGYWEIDKGEGTTASPVMVATRRHFAHCGIPKKVVLANGPPYSSTAFKEFAETYQFVHETSSPESCLKRMS